MNGSYQPRINDDRRGEITTIASIFPNRWTVSLHIHLVGQHRDSYRGHRCHACEELRQCSELRIGLEFGHALRDRIVYRFMDTHNKVDVTGYDLYPASVKTVYRYVWAPGTILRG